MDNFKQDEEQLGKIAFEFRGACNKKLSKDEIDTFARQYAEVVNRLIASGKWTECPAPEDQLPVDLMPEAFFDYWYMERKPQRVNYPANSAVQGIVGLVMWVAIIVGLVYIMSACGGCWKSGTQLFWH